MTATRDLLRLSTAGHVDDGKSTLIGRLLHDARALADDQLAELERRRRPDGELDFALLTDGLKAERQQGITIDVAYRAFSSPRRHFILADSPGHVQYTRNMASGASTAELAVIVVDAARGIRLQTRRHTAIAALLGIPHLVLAVNKMDLVGYRRDRFDQIRDDFLSFARRLGARRFDALPVSALRGENVAGPTDRMPWYKGPSLLALLEEAPLDKRRAAALRFPVQRVCRGGDGFRGYAGQLASGQLGAGDEVLALPSGRRSRVRSILCFDQTLASAAAPRSVTLELEDELDLDRGDMLVRAAEAPSVGHRFEARLVWFDEEPCRPGRRALIKHTTRLCPVTIEAIPSRLDISSLEQTPAHALAQNEIGRARLDAHHALAFDAYQDNRATGSFILIDPDSGRTLAGGMILGAVAAPPVGAVTPRERAARLGQRPLTLWLEGPGAAALGERLERALFARGRHAVFLSPPPGRREAIARALFDAGLIAIITGPPPEPGAAWRVVTASAGALFIDPEGDRSRVELAELTDRLFEAARLIGDPR